LFCPSFASFAFSFVAEETTHSLRFVTPNTVGAICIHIYDWVILRQVVAPLLPSNFCPATSFSFCHPHCCVFLHGLTLLLCIACTAGIDDHPFELWSREKELYFLPPEHYDPSKVHHALQAFKRKQKEKSGKNGKRGKMKPSKLPSRSLVDLQVSHMKLLTEKGINAIMSRSGMRRIVVLNSCCTASSLRLVSRSNVHTLQILHLSGEWNCFQYFFQLLFSVVGV
jgi:hypothetical protein